jgi:hypothetical protein
METFTHQVAPCTRAARQWKAGYILPENCTGFILGNWNNHAVIQVQ